MQMRRFLAAASIAAASGFAGAQVTPIGEFTAELYEGFEGIIAPGPYVGPMPIFGGAATIDDNFTDPWIVTVLSGGGNEVWPYNGNLMGLTPTGWTNIVFDTPVLKFGGHFGMVNLIPGGNVTFRDAKGDVIDNVPFDLTPGEWSWYGWQSSVPIKSISVHTGGNPGSTSVFDDFHASYVPEPGAFGLLLAGATILLRRRS